MELYALIKERGVTHKVSSEDVSLLINEIINDSIKDILDEVAKKHSDNYKISFKDFDKNSIGNLKGYKIAIPYLRKILIDNSYINDGDVIFHKRFSVSEIRNIVSNSNIDVTIKLDNFDYILKELGLIKVSDNRVNDVVIHKCSNCADLSPLTCEKAEYVKKNISDYDFITDGYQIFSVSGDSEYLEKFIILKCKNYRLLNEPIPVYQKAKNNRQKIKSRRF